MTKGAYIFIHDCKFVPITEGRSDSQFHKVVDRNWVKGYYSVENDPIMTGEQWKRSLGMIVPQLLLFYGRTIVVGSVRVLGIPMANGNNKNPKSGARYYNLGYENSKFNIEF